MLSSKIGMGQHQHVRMGKSHNGKRSRQASRSTEMRAREQARQWDRQRQDIHPAEVVERLASVEAKKVQVVVLPEAVPDAELDREYHVLPVRTLREESPP